MDVFSLVNNSVNCLQRTIFLLHSENVFHHPYIRLGASYSKIWPLCIPFSSTSHGTYSRAMKLSKVFLEEAVVLFPAIIIDIFYPLL